MTLSFIFLNSTLKAILLAILGLPNPTFYMSLFLMLLAASYLLVKNRISLQFIWNPTAAKKSLIEDVLKQLYHVELSQRTTDLKMLSGALDVPLKRTVRVVESMHKQNLITSEDAHLALTNDGRSYALKIIRIHRLWEKYLSERTGFDKSLWHDLAEAKEHQLTAAQANELYESLGRPRFDPHGDPILTELGEIIEIISTPLASLGVNTIAKIVHIEDEPKSIYRQIIKKKLHIGSHIKIIATNNLKIIFESEGQIFEFSTVVASNINALALNEQDIYEQNKIRLSALNVGETATITGISSECRGANRRRLLDLGFIKGTPLEMEYAGPNQNPRAYKIRNTLIALRNDQADLILIEKK